MTNLDSIFKSRDITLLTKVHLVKAMVFPMVIYGCESWTIKKAERFWTVVLEKTLESPLDCKEIQPVHSEGDQSWVFIGMTDVEAETPLLWSPDAKSWLIWKDPDAGKDWGQEEKGMAEDEMAGWHHWLDEHGFGWIPGVGDGQGGLACCSSWGHKESDMTEWLNWTELNWCCNSAVHKSNWSFILSQFMRFVEIRGRLNQDKLWDPSVASRSVLLVLSSGNSFFTTGSLIEGILK